MKSQLKKLGVFKDDEVQTIEIVLEAEGNKVMKTNLYTDDKQSDCLSIPTYYAYPTEAGQEEIPVDKLYEAILKSLCQVVEDDGKQENLIRRTKKKNLVFFFENDTIAPSIAVIKAVCEKEEDMKKTLGYETISYVLEEGKQTKEITEKIEKEIKNVQIKIEKAKYKLSGVSLFIKSKYQELEEEEKQKLTKWKLEHEIYEKNRKDYLSWDQYFMAVAQLSAMRSKDPSTQVGACIVSDDNRILSIGYNGAPNGFTDASFHWDRAGEDLYTKYFYVCHAEMNAILNYRGSKKELENAKIYVDLFPCNECAKLIIQSGIKEVIYLSDKYNGTDSNLASKHLFDVCGVKYKHLELGEEKTITIHLK